MHSQEVLRNSILHLIESTKKGNLQESPSPITDTPNYKNVHSIKVISWKIVEALGRAIEEWSNWGVE